MLTAAPVNFIFSKYIETKIITQGLVYATCSDGVKTRINSNSGAAELQSFGDEMCKRTWLQL